MEVTVVVVVVVIVIEVVAVPLVAQIKLFTMQFGYITLTFCHTTISLSCSPETGN